MHLALYRSERPERFSEIIGQKHIVRILQNQVKTDTVRQSYLFTGTRGTGKTTTARILAKAVNCIGSPEDGMMPCGECENCKAIKEGNFLDVIELDAASNNSVDAIRGIIDSCQYPPYYGKYKVYIVDEVHMLSASAENAFLKILEEPPKHVIFILATTNPEKVRETIRSRCMQLDFRRVSETDLVDGMRRICERKNINITDEALGLVAQKADGSVRDALSILEQCISGGDELLDVEAVQDYIGSAGTAFFLSLTQAVIDRNMPDALGLIANMIRAGRDAKLMLNDWMEHYRNLMVAKYVDDTRNLLNSSEENVNRMRLQASQLDAQGLENAIRLLSEYVNQARWSTQPRILLETAVLHLMNGKATPSSKADELLAMMPVSAAQQKLAKSMPQPVTPDTLPSNVMPVQNVNAANAEDMAAAAGEDAFYAVPVLDKSNISQLRERPTSHPNSPDTLPPNVMPVQSVNAANAEDMAAAAGEGTFYAVPVLDSSNTSQLRESQASHPSSPDTLPPNVMPVQSVSEANAADMAASAGEDKFRAVPILNSNNAGESSAAMLQDFETMWSEIVDKVAAGNRSFRVMVGINSRIDEYRNGEIIVKVKPNKMKFAEDRKEDILAAARELYGEHTYVTLRLDDGKATPGNKETGATQGSDSTILAQDEIVAGPIWPERANSEISNDAPLMDEDDYYTSIGIAESQAESDASEYPIDYVEDMAAQMQEEDDVVSEITEEVSALFGVSVKVVE